MAATEDSDSETVFTIIVPTAIMALLFLGNAVVLYVLFVLRKRNKKICKEDEERAAIVINNGSPEEMKNGDCVDVPEEENKVHSKEPKAVDCPITGMDEARC